MRYKVKIEKKVVKELEKINEPYYTKIKNAMLALGNNPRPIGYIKLKNREGYRIRVADYRIIYNIVEDALWVKIIDMGHRKDIYN
jgi:mRNA interferase RelE/StbE